MPDSMTQTDHISEVFTLFQLGPHNFLWLSHGYAAAHICSDLFFAEKDRYEWFGIFQFMLGCINSTEVGHREIALHLL